MANKKKVPVKKAQPKSPSIDNVTTEILDAGLRLCGISLRKETIDKIIDLVELIEINGEKTSLKDMVNLRSEWKENSIFAA